MKEKNQGLKVIENLYAEDGYPKYYVVNEDDIESEAADGQNYDYALTNSECDCEYDLMQAIGKEFGVDTVSMYLSGTDNDIICDDGDISEELLSKINVFKRAWCNEHECHYNCKYYNYFNGSNWKSLLLYCELDEVNQNKRYELLNDEEAEPILNAYNRAKKAKHNFDGGYATEHDDETGLDIRFSQFSYNVGYASIF